jgi:DNA modification methylase
LGQALLIMTEYIFKTVYFPRERVRNSSSARITVSVPANDGLPNEFISFFNGVSSREFRLALGDPFVEDVEQQAQEERRSVSSICVRKLLHYFDQRLISNGTTTANQLQLAFPDQLDSHVSPSSAEPIADLGVTFRDSLRQGVFGWYPYVEGFGATYTRDAILRYRPRMVFDPFGGSGTTQLASACLGIDSVYSEINPFMRFVAETKVTATRWARKHFDSFEMSCSLYLKELRSARFTKRASKVDLTSYEKAFPERDFFEENHVRELLSAVELARSISSDSPYLRDILLLACAANAVRSSNMTRRADLRRRRPDEYITRVVDVRAYLIETVDRFIGDVKLLPATMASTSQASEDARQLPSRYTSAIDFALTSPPYLNGTNYFRNTKIELWLLGFIQSENELAQFRQKAIAAGINNVTRDRKATHRFEKVEEVVEKLTATDGDRRIPLLVRNYFSDMFEMFESVHRCLRPSGIFLLDIGDSKFYGIHVPTDKLLADAAESAGLVLRSRNVLARRHSRDKSPLVQVELVFEKAASAVAIQVPDDIGATTLEQRAGTFQSALPYKHAPFNKRNWGHGLHSLCSYQGKLKPAIAHSLITNFIEPGKRVLDPLGGVGTIPFEAALLGHPVVSNDMSPLAATVAKAKLAPPSLQDAERAISRWWKAVERIPEKSLDYSSAEFGLNGTAREFFHPETLTELLKARTVFLTQDPGVVDEPFIWASLLHVLHGNRPYALSRTSHPITPFHPQGPSVYKSVREKVLQRVRRALSEQLPNTFLKGQSIYGDFRLLPEKEIGKFGAIVTSPPFLGMRFDRPNWLRLWFCGWGEKDFHIRSRAFLERQQTSSPAVYKEFFATMYALIENNGLVILHVGSGGSRDLADDLKTLGQDAFRLRAEVIENVQAVEQHGIRDKGLTTHHHYLFFTPRT